MAEGASRPNGFSDGRVGAATVVAAVLVSAQVVGKSLRDALFLGTFPVERLPLAMIGAALVSAVVVLTSSRVSLRYSPRTVLRVVLAASAALFVVSAAFARSNPEAAAWITYLQAGALSAAAVSAFWSLTIESLDPYAAKVAVPRIMAGATLGGVVGGLFTWRLASLLSVGDMLLVAAVLDATGFVAVSALLPRSRDAVRKRSAGSAGESTPSSIATPAPALSYVRALGVLVALAAVTQAILDFLLSAAALDTLGRGEKLLSFFALFQMSVGLLAFLLQAVASRSALERFGVGPSLAVSPVLVLVGALSTMFATPLVAAVTMRGLDGVLGASIYRSAYEILFSPLSRARRRAIKPLLDLGLDRLGALAGSALVAVVLSIDPRAYEVLFGLVLALATARVGLSPLLHRGYERVLADKLRVTRLAASERVSSLTSSIVAFDLPSAEVPDSAEPDSTRSDPTLEDLRELRSGDLERVTRVLRTARGDPLLAPQVVALLADDLVAREAADWLVSQEPAPVGVLVDALLDEHVHEKARRRAARVLGKVNDARAADALLFALDRVPSEVRLGTCHALARVAARRHVPREPLLAAASRVAAAHRGPGDRDVDEIFFLLAAAYPDEPIDSALHALGGDHETRGTALEWLDVLLPRDVKEVVLKRIVRTTDAPRSAAAGRSQVELRRVLLSHAPGPSAEDHDEAD